VTEPVENGVDNPPKYSWSQPVCDDDWFKREPTRTPVRIVTRPTERCAFCGQITHSGIYVRIDPSTVPFPRVEGFE
jgi:hypothetical protein